TAFASMILSPPPLHRLLLFYCHADHRALHSFPTRRSSDLVARSHTSGTRPSSKIIRASVTSTADRLDSEMRSAMPSPTMRLLGAVTNAPPRAPTRMSTRPVASSTRRASRTVTRLTPYRSHRSRSLGSLSPAVSCPERISRRIWSTMTSEMRPTLTLLSRSPLFGAAPPSVAGAVVPGLVTHALYALTDRLLRRCRPCRDHESWCWPSSPRHGL